MYKDITGMRFGRWTVIEAAGHNKNKDLLWKCVCDCGNTREIRGGDLRSGHSKSCGCLHREELIERLTSHGLTHTRLFRIWQAMKQRCYNPKNTWYNDYGRRGIGVCDEWKTDFVSFYNWSMEHGYKDDLSIDRIDSDGNYSPDNCRWATAQTQSRNKRDTIMVDYHGETDTFTGMCRKLNVNRSTIQKRCNTYKCSFEEAVDNYKRPGPFKEHWLNK